MCGLNVAWDLKENDRRGWEMMLNMALRSNTYELPENPGRANETGDQKLRRYLISSNVFTVTMIDLVPVSDNNTKKASMAAISECEITFAIENKKDNSVRFMKGGPVGKKFQVERGFYSESQISPVALDRFHAELEKRRELDSSGLTDSNRSVVPDRPE